MTTLWARMLVIKAWEKGEITEECAQYFDKLLFKSSTYWYSLDNGKRVLLEFPNFNTTYYELSVMHKLGCPENSEKFDILQYIKNTSFEKGYTVGDETVYLSNIINEDYSKLICKISDKFDIFTWDYIREDGEWSKESNLESLIIIKNYLEKTNYKTLNPCSRFKENLEKCIAIVKRSKTQEEKTKTYDKPAYTDLIDADY